MAATTIVTGITVEGKITGQADVKVDGVVIGEINLNSSIYVSSQGKTEASINAENVFIAGTHIGNVTAKELVQISETAIVKGEIRAPYISIEKGAKFSGMIETTDAAEAPEQSSTTTAFNSLVNDEKDSKETDTVPALTVNKTDESSESNESATTVEKTDEKSDISKSEEDGKKKENQTTNALAA